jgi:probable selenium-dependent hydroxylase accessory protein YqeC
MAEPRTAHLVDALGIDGGDLVCVVGAGGKKTTLYALAGALERAVVTATVRIPIFDDHVADVVVTDDPRAAVESKSARPLGVVPEREREDRYRGYDPAVVSDLAADLDDVAGGRRSPTARRAAPDDVVLVKADGARARLLKAPNENEPQLPDRTDIVVPIASARAVGKPLTAEFVHRPERVAALTGRREGERIRPVDVATVLASEEGGRKGIPDGATVVPMVNMADDDELEAVGREIAAEVVARADVPRVVVARVVDPDPVVAVVESG